MPFQEVVCIDNIIQWSERYLTRDLAWVMPEQNILTPQKVKYGKGKSLFRNLQGKIVVVGRVYVKGLVEELQWIYLRRGHQSSQFPALLLGSFTSPTFIPGKPVIFVLCSL